MEEPVAQHVHQHVADIPAAPPVDVVEDVDDDSAAFECNICYELSREPVVTYCGHLYCWPCLYRWLQLKDTCQTCPVCKAGVDKDKVVPIYGRGGGSSDPRKKTQDDYGGNGQNAGQLLDIPGRPPGVRNPVNDVSSPQLGVQNPPMGSMNFIPALFGVQSTGPGGIADPLTPEQQHQAFLSRLLLMLGSFVIMCLLLF
eukprot:jgi/Botrbrau1/22724/Bobra.0132s0063.1